MFTDRDVTLAPQKTKKPQKSAEQGYLATLITYPFLMGISIGFVSLFFEKEVIYFLMFLLMIVSVIRIFSIYQVKLKNKVVRSDLVDINIFKNGSLALALFAATVAIFLTYLYYNHQFVANAVLSGNTAGLTEKVIIVDVYWFVVTLGYCLAAALNPRVESKQLFTLAALTFFFLWIVGALLPVLMFLQ